MKCPNTVHWGIVVTMNKPLQLVITLTFCLWMALPAVPDVLRPIAKAAPPVTPLVFTGSVVIEQDSSMELPAPAATRILVGAPNVLGAQMGKDGNIRLTGKRLGETVLNIWSASGRDSYKIQVVSSGFVPKTQDALSAKILDPIDLPLKPGDSHLIHGKKITCASVSIPDIVNIVPVSSTEILMNAVKEGNATVKVWDCSGVATYRVTVAKEPVVVEDVVATITEHIASSAIKVKLMGDCICLEGVVQSAAEAKRAVSIAETRGKKILNLITVQSTAPEDAVTSLKTALRDYCLTYEVLPDNTVLITGGVATESDAHRVRQVIESWTGPQASGSDRTTVNNKVSLLETDYEPADVKDQHITKAFATTQPPGTVVVGEDYYIARHVYSGRVPGGPLITAMIEVNPALAKQVLVCAQVIEVNRSKALTLGIQWAEIFGDNPINPLIILENRPSPVPLGDMGPFARTPLQASLRALITNNAAKVLSEPKLLITDGKSASILVGGELPIPVAQNATVGSTSISVEWKPFGIQLAVRPRVTPDNRILLTMTPEVSTPDFTNAVVAAGIRIPTLIVRRATTTVHIASGECLAVGGLLSTQDIKQIQRLPLLSQIPILGEFFKTYNTRKEINELVILVTPSIVQNNQPTPIALPR